MEKTKIVDEETMERVLSPESLDVYIRVAKPGAWLLTIALLLLVAAVIVWGFVGSMPETLVVNGVIDADGKIVAYVDTSVFNPAIDSSSAVIVTMDGKTANAEVTAISANPLSQPEIAASLSSDWLTDMMAVQGYAYQVTLTSDLPQGDYSPGTLVQVTLITAEIKPISLILS